ncbi:transposable element Tc3 transposase [Trichonephila clavipes]|uniref:Transposable element Tc3 transposase n=1 Tax=Trichonephila clavipes TaxID=2585209 RepID=A0A8X6VLF4_TRICX|nr:transposable element Tc3 transposase [Trichonephila clavipes]
MARVAMNCFQAFPTLPWPARPPGFFPIRAITGRAPAHFSADVRSALDTVYAGRLIEWGGTVNWPARSPHLSCLDFFLCGYVNCLVYASPVNSDEALVAGYIREMPGVFANVRQSLRGGVGPASLLELWFQQNGATCHTARATIDLLKDTFGDRLISRFGPVNWSPRSCDLTLLDYFLWGYVKSFVYADKPQTLEHLEDNIRLVIADIRPQILEKVIVKWTSRLDYSRGSYMPEIIFSM